MTVGRKRRMPIFVSAAAYTPGGLGDPHVTQLQASIVLAHPDSAVLIFNKPAGWLPERDSGGLVYGGLLWSDNG